MLMRLTCAERCSIESLHFKVVELVTTDRGNDARCLTEAREASPYGIAERLCQEIQIRPRLDRVVWEDGCDYVDTVGSDYSPATHGCHAEADAVGEMSTAQVGDLLTVLQPVDH